MTILRILEHLFAALGIVLTCIGLIEAFYPRRNDALERPTWSLPPESHDPVLEAQAEAERQLWLS